MSTEHRVQTEPERVMLFPSHPLLWLVVKKPNIWHLTCKALMLMAFNQILETPYNSILPQYYLAMHELGTVLPLLVQTGSYLAEQL